MTWVSIHKCLKQCLAPSATFCFRINVSLWVLGTHSPVYLCSSSNPEPASSDHTPEVGLITEGPGAALSSLHSPSASITAFWVASALGQLLTPPHFMGPGRNRAGVLGNRWATQGQRFKKPPETGKFLGQGFLEETVLHMGSWGEDLQMVEKKKSSWIPGAKNMKSLMRFDSRWAYFSPQINHDRT